jgi:dihydrodipicolinate synthase/N-acetylneuraminate lyase
MIETKELLEALNSVTTIPIIPFRNGEIDYDAHAKNVEYLIRSNRLEPGPDGKPRKRVISVAGTSLIHHIAPEEQTKIFDVTGRVMGDDGVLMSAIVPNPISVAGRLVEEQSKLQRPPDVYLVMPLTGTYNSEGLYHEMMAFGKKYGEKTGARFLYYFRQPSDRDAVIRLLNDSPHFIGVKIGTGEQDVKPMIDGVGDNALVIWGIGDRSTGAAELGAKGHTSGISVLAAGAGDAINNAQRSGDYARARQVEADVNELEEIRFMNGRAYNYSAVVEAMNMSGFNDIDGGDSSGPFNPPVPAEIRARLEHALETVLDYH